MEQKAKRIGKLNIIDLIAIVLIVAVLALAAWKFIGKNGDSISYDRPQTKVTYQVKVEGVAPELYEKLSGPSAVSADGLRCAGGRPDRGRGEGDLSGAGCQWKLGHGPGPCDVDLHRDHHHPTAEVMTTKVGDQEVRIGKTDYILKSEYIEFSDGTITNVIWGD